MLTILELDYLLCGLERIAGSGPQPIGEARDRRRRSIRRALSASDRQIERQRIEEATQALDDLLVECFNLLSPEEKRKFFQLNGSYEKIGFLLRAGAFRQGVGDSGTIPVLRQA